jgi:NAD(P)-dependent dehydrogenase (short-subunit alcohol dehydrogenase family)
LLSHPELDLNPSIVGMAYAVAKRGNQLRVQAAAHEYGLKGARVNSVSPGVTATALGRKELETGGARSMVEGSAMGRLGTVDDIAGAVEFLVGAAFVTGTDLLVDGGAVAARRWPPGSG